MAATTPTTLADRAIIRLSGDDGRGFLQGLVTNDVAGPLPVHAALLSAQGKALFDFIVWADPASDDLLIDAEAAAADALVRRLSLYRLRRAISIARDETLAVHWTPPGSEPGSAEGAPDPRLAALGQRWIAPATPGDASAAWRAHRLGLGVTEGQAELGDGATLWLEANAGDLHGVSFTKGCYVGQENTARMNWRQKVNRRMVVVPIAEADAARQRIAYPDLGLSVELRRTEAIPPAAWRDWMGPRGADHSEEAGA